MKLRWRRNTIQNCSNKDTLLIFTYDGVGHKIPVHYIESGRGIPKDNISNIQGQIWII